MVCDWTDDSENTDLAARKHVDREKHAVITENVPFEEVGKDAPVP